MKTYNWINQRRPIFAIPNIENISGWKLKYEQSIVSKFLMIFDNSTYPPTYFLTYLPTYLPTYLGTQSSNINKQTFFFPSQLNQRRHQNRNVIRNSNVIRTNNVVRTIDVIMGVKRQQTWPDLICNVVLVGDAKVGKTSLVQKAVNEKFSEVSVT